MQNIESKVIEKFLKSDAAKQFTREALEEIQSRRELLANEIAAATADYQAALAELDGERRELASQVDTVKYELGQVQTRLAAVERQAHGLRTERQRRRTTAENELRRLANPMLDRFHAELSNEIRELLQEPPMIQHETQRTVFGGKLVNRIRTDKPSRERRLKAMRQVQQEIETQKLNVRQDDASIQAWIDEKWESLPDVRPETLQAA